MNELANKVMDAMQDFEFEQKLIPMDDRIIAIYDSTHMVQANFESDAS